ncbi:glycerophosphodiester phosphodiesterase family protein [Maribellus sp. CM-23]|uniref:glycerophosphodiester phosphodiesterase family protein n=1 Tax=Maribellus sp. CM-23 TaxID=2781026 RepID=UPI001F3FB696|nr:glycerophosphodiester phosphodiesterase family protein [Maribellus sp. CM-23]MCE4566605.1 glycerophosphodiester phosphodiesterase family protein [Maribellus sp. CM-23]
MNFKLISIILLVLSLSLSASSNNPSGFKKNQNHLEEIINHLNTPTNDYVLVAAHRGDWRNAPENSLMAIQNAIAMGVDIVEIDVRMTKDSVLVLMHDAKIDRTTTGKGKLSEWTLDSLNTITLKNGCGIATKHKIPTLEEAMHLVKGKVLVNLDKCSGYMDKAFEVIHATGTTNQVIFKGTDEIDKVREKYGSLLDEIIYMPIISENTPLLDGFVDDFLTESSPLAFEVLYNSDDSPMFKVIKNIKDKRSRVWVNTMWDSLCGDHYDDLGIAHPDKAWGWVIEHGANIIQTDRPALLIEYLREKGLHD